MATSMTRGAPWRNVLVFSVPLFVGNLAQQLYSFSDALVVGRVLGVDALAAIGCTAGLNFFLTGFVWGMTNGLAIITSQRFGARDAAGIRRAVAAALIVCAATCVLLSAIGAPLAGLALRAMNTPPQILAGATQFLTIVFASLLATGVSGLVASLMRALGESKAPTALWIVSSILNIGLVFLFVAGFGWGIPGAAWATVTAQVLQVAAGLWYVRTRMPQLVPHRADWRVSPAELLEHAKLGWAMGFQSSVISIGEIAIQRALNSLGPIAVAGATAGTRIGQLALGPLSCFGVAMAVYTGQNFGARQFSRIKAGVRQTLALSEAYAVIIGVTFLVAGGALAGLFLGPHEKEAISLAHTYLVFSAIGYPLLGPLFVLRSTLQGIGRTAVPTIAGFGELAGRIAVAAFLVGPLGFRGVCLAGPVAWLGSCLPLVIAWLIERRRLGRLADEPEPDGAPAIPVASG